MGRVVSWDELGQEVARARANGGRVVFTNGCFDLIHAGHVRYLRAARALGDVLVVGLNSDRSVAALKQGRPVVPEAARAEVLAALEMVDLVAVFDQDTPYELIRHVRPDILVKGGDWEVKDIVGSDLVPETRRLPFEEGLSTTGIIRRIKSLEP